jgi:ribulose-5-phosphate 4-epimerase/fuculose-1-phosphate aldolase
MAEVYTGTKFRTVFARRDPPDDQRLTGLIEWCHHWGRLGVVGDTVGNLSARTPAGFLINRTAGDLKTIAPGEFVEVLQTDMAGRTLTVAGAYEPSSESMMHAGIYAARPEVNAVFHGHSAPVLQAAERLRIPVTPHERPYGTPELVAELLQVLDGHDFIVIRNHGFVSLGRTMADAGRRLETVLEKT